MQEQTFITLGVGIDALRLDSESLMYGAVDYWINNDLAGSYVIIGLLGLLVR